eukprot:jgi/Psemu1/60747/gm1.60747_g
MMRNNDWWKQNEVPDLPQNTSEDDQTPLPTRQQRSRHRRREKWANRNLESSSSESESSSSESSESDDSSTSSSERRRNAKLVNIKRQAAETKRQMEEINALKEEMRAARARGREKERRYEAEMNALRQTIQESRNKDDKMEALRQEVRLAKEKATGQQLLKAKPIQDFDGQQENWTKWKSDAIATFAATGHEEIMNDSDAARNAPSKNKALWGTLLSACSGGSAHSKIIKHEDTFDGHAAWQELLGWYDSDNRRESYAETLKLRLRYNQLHPNGNISEYINTFELTYHKLRKIPPYHMTEWDAKSIFARNIRDPNLERFKEELLEHKTERTLEEMIVKLRIHDEELARTVFDSNRGGTKRVRRTPDGPNKRHRTGPSGIGTLTGTIHPNLKGAISTLS